MPDDGNGRRVRILLVEDELLIGMDLAMILEEWGHTVEGPHRTPEQAVEAARSFGPDLAILDVNLGRGTTSAPVARHLDEVGVPYVFLTGYSSGSRAEPRFECENGILRKPVDTAELRAKLSEMVARLDQA
ncbi:response regulator [Palleronia sediminis]|nr:response regulator [Palleronia sediminis]